MANTDVAQSEAMANKELSELEILKAEITQLKAEIVSYHKTRSGISLPKCAGVGHILKDTCPKRSETKIHFVHREGDHPGCCHYWQCWNPAANAKRQHYPAIVVPSEELLSAARVSLTAGPNVFITLNMAVDIQLSIVDGWLQIIIEAHVYRGEFWHRPNCCLRPTV